MVDPALSSGILVKESDLSEAEQMDRLRAQIARSRRRLDNSLVEIEHRVSESVDWRRQVGAHPWLTLTVAAVAGYLLGRLGAPSTREPRS